MHVEGNRLVQIDPAHARRVVEDHCHAVGLPSPDTWSPEEASVLLGRLDYECPPAVILEFARKGYICPPENDRALTAVDLYGLMCALESRRRWKATPSRHDVKKSGFRLQLETLIRNGVNPPVHDLDEHSIEDLLLRLVACDERMMRESLYETIKLKLAGFEE